MHCLRRVTTGQTLHAYSRYFQLTLSRSKPLKTVPYCYFHATGGQGSAQEENMDDLQKNPYYGKYADKLKKLQEESPEEFSSRVDSLKEEKDRQKEMKRKDAEQQREEILGKQQTSGLSKGGPKELSAVMKLELIKDKTPEEVGEIWQKFHSTKDGIYGVLQAADFAVMQQNATKYPTFIYPLPRADGYEFILSQFSGNQCHFTPLIEYQTHKENAPPCMTMIHYTDLQLDKGIVLMAGDLDTQKISKEDALMLGHQVQMYYGAAGNGARQELLRKFSEQPDTFMYTDLIDEFQKITSSSGKS